jgi:hypothetical protein
MDFIFSNTPVAFFASKLRRHGRPSPGSVGAYGCYHSAPLRDANTPVSSVAPPAYRIIAPTARPKKPSPLLATFSPSSHGSFSLSPLTTLSLSLSDSLFSLSSHDSLSLSLGLPLLSRTPSFFFPHDTLSLSRTPFSLSPLTTLSLSLSLSGQRQ